MLGFRKWAVLGSAVLMRWDVRVLLQGCSSIRLEWRSPKPQVGGSIPSAPARERL